MNFSKLFLDQLVGSGVTLLIGFIGFLFGALFRRTSKLVKKLGFIEKGVLAILHDRIYQNCSYHRDQGYVTLTDRVNLDYMYKPYQSLGGNGICEDMYNKLFDLPYTPGGEKK